MLESVYSRAVLKLSGESLKGSSPYGIDPDALAYLADQIKEASGMGVRGASTAAISYSGGGSGSRSSALPSSSRTAPGGPSDFMKQFL